MARTNPVRSFLFMLLLAAATAAGAQTRTITTVAGGNYHGDGQAALGAHLLVVRGVARDSAGNVYFSEPGRHAVRKIAAGTGIVTLYAGSYIIGTGGDGGPATQARFNTPGALAAAPNGDLYIVDSGNHRVRKVTAATGIITTVAGTGIPGNGPVNGPATSAALNAPGGLVVTASGDLIIADTQNHVLRKVDPSGIITTLPLTSFRATPFPQGVAEIGGSIYVADPGQGLIVRDSNVTGQEVIVGNPDDVPPPGSADGPALAMRLVQPVAVIPRTGNDFYTLEGGGAPKLRRYDAATATIATESMAVGSQAQAMVLESTNAVIIAESGLIRRFDTAADTNSVVAGNRTFTGDGGPATQAYLGGPQGAARGPDGHLYVADTTTNTVRRIDASTGTITRFAGGGSATDGSGGPATGVRLSFPRALRFDAGGNLYILDVNNGRIRKVTPAGIVTTFAGGGTSTADGASATQFQFPAGLLDMAIDSQGNVVVISTLGVAYRVNAATMTVTRFAGAEGRSGFSGDGGAAVDAAFSIPGSVAFDAAGALYIADNGNDRIRKVSGGIVTTVVSANLGGQAFLAIDATGAIYYSRTAEDDVMRFANGTTSLVAGTSGVIGASGDGGPAASARFFAPTYLSMTPSGSLLVTDANNFRVREISPPAAQAIAFASLPPRASNAPPFTVSATGGGSGNPVVFTSLSTSICTTSGTNGSTVTVTGAFGTCTLAANQAGNANFAAAPQVSRAFNVTTGFTVTPSQTTPNGSITPSTPQSVASGGQIDFSVVPDPDYNRLVSGTCGGSFQPDGTTFRTNPVNGNCTVIAFFGIKTFVVTASKTGNGTITPSGIQAIAIHGQVTYTVAPNPGHAVAMGGTCGGSLAGNSYTTHPVEADCTVTATFTPVPFTVTPTAGAGGTISPGTPQTVLQGLTRTFTITPGSAFLIDTVGGTCGGSLSGNTYTTAPITADCTVTATFKDKVTVFTVTSTSLGGAGSFSGVLQALRSTCPGGVKRVEFNIPAATDPGCNPATGICVIETPDNMGGVQCPNTTVDGYSQPGAARNTRTDRGNDARIRIELAGSLTTRQTLQLRGDDGGSGNSPSIRNVSIHGIAFPRTTLAGFGANTGSVLGGGGGFVISGNWFGFHADGTVVTTGPAGTAITLVGSRIDGNRVGGPDPADRNLIGGRSVAFCCEASYGPAINANGVRDSVFEGNYINVDTNGNALATNGGYASAFLLVNSLSQGTLSTRDNIIRRNVALMPAGTVLVTNGESNTFTENVLVKRGNEAAISLGGQGNQNQAAPVIGAVTYTGSGVNASGTLQSAPNEDFRIELFSNSEIGANGFGSAERFVGAVTPTSDASGLAAWSIVLPADARNMTATATRISTGDTSELSLQHVSPNLFTVTPSAGANGSITPSAPQLVAQGATPSFVLTPNAGYAVDAVGGTCGGTLAGLTFTTSAVTVSCTVNATFKAAVIAPPSADFNGNGKADLLFRNADGRGAIWLMEGLVTVASAEIFPAGTAWSVAQIADTDGDGKADLVWSNPDGRVAVYTMDGTTTLTRTNLLAAGGGWSVAGSGDLDGDGKADIVFQNADGSIAAYLMNGGTVVSGATILGPGTGWSVTRVADFDGDGKKDLFFKHADGRAAIYLMNGLTPTASVQILNAGSGWTATHATDLDGDGKADIVWHNDDGRTAAWLMNGTTMTAGAELLGAGLGWAVTRVGDFDGDGKSDLVFEHTDGRIAIFLMNGIAPTATTQILNAGGGWTVKRVADLNGDGRSDLVFENTDGRVAIWLMNGTTMASGSGILGAGTGWAVSPVSP